MNAKPQYCPNCLVKGKEIIMQGAGAIKTAEGKLPVMSCPRCEQWFALLKGAQLEVKHSQNTERLN